MMREWELSRMEKSVIPAYSAIGGVSDILGTLFSPNRYIIANFSKSFVTFCSVFAPNAPDHESPPRTQLFQVSSVSPSTPGSKNFPKNVNLSIRAPGKIVMNHYRHLVTKETLMRFTCFTEKRKWPRRSLLPLHAPWRCL